MILTAFNPTSMLVREGDAHNLYLLSFYLPEAERDADSNHHSIESSKMIWAVGYFLPFPFLAAARCASAYSTTRCIS